jgi:hypothetical protein
LPKPTFAEAVGANPTARTAAAAEAQMVFKNVLDINLLPVHFTLFISHSHLTEQQVRAAKWRVFVFPWSAVGDFRTHPPYIIHIIVPSATTTYKNPVVAFTIQPKRKNQTRTHPCGDLPTDFKQR